jgi:CTP:molybdopterin cytidylyltransferase MocA
VPKPAAIILAAGESRRMGAPKALLEIGGVTFAQRLASTFGAVCDPVILVTGAVTQIHAAPAVEVRNPDWQKGQLTSLQAGLQAIPAGAAAAFFTPVDCPLFREETVAMLWAAFERKPTSAFVVPRQGERRGHPVLAGPKAIAELLALPASAQARDVVHRWRSETAYVDVDDPGIFADIDTPADYRRIAT